MAHPPDDAVSKKAGQGAVNRGVGFAEDARQFRRFDERHPAEGMEEPLVGKRHVSSVAKEGRAVHPSHGSAGVGRQRTPLSWAEFMAEEPVKPKVRSRKPKPAAASLFDWALALEQDREREAEPVGAGR